MSEGPMWLVKCSPEGEVKVNQEAIRALARLPWPLRVVSIFGPSQSGKSYLLNLLAGSTGFTVSRGASCKDLAIYMWSLPDDDNRETSLILLDADGFEEDLIEGRNACPIFTLSLLLSSVFLYNTWGPVSLDTLDQLFHVTMLTNQVSLPAIWADESSLPEFVWCVRDVELDVNMGDVELTPADFLDAVLNEVKGQESPSSVISKLFPRTRMKLFDFCHPLEGSEDVGNLSLSELNPCFLRQTETLRRSIQRSAPKVFQGCQAVSGRELGAILEQFVDSMSKGSIIQLDGMIEKTAAMEDVQDLVFPRDLEVSVKRQKPVVEMETPLREACRDLHTTPPATGREGRDQVDRDHLDMEKPVCLIENTSADELRVNQEALDILTSISQPVVVVSIVGMYRTGKSYLMNRLAGKRTGFSLGNTIQAETKGIWMWCVPHPCRKGHTLVLLDTEGLGDVEKGSQKNDNWIFALAVLLSSTFVYNSLGTINNDAVTSLHYVTELTDHIKVKSSQEKGEETSSEYVRFFPSFIWAVRDFNLELKRDGQSITADEYLENSLKLIQGFSKKATYSNEARECIRNYFPCRKCFVFVPPTSNEKLKLLEKLNDSELDEEFVKQTFNFCSYIFNCAKEKLIKGGFPVTGSLLGNLAVTYVDAIRSGSIPCLENAVLALSQIENSKAIEESHAVYRRLMEELVELHTEALEDLSSIHDVCLKEALQLFMKRSFKDQGQKYQTQLMERVKADYEVKCQENEQISQNHCSALLLQLEYDVDEQESYMKPGGYNHFRTDLDNLIQLYKNKPGKGVKAEQVLEEYLKEKNETGKLILMADKSLSEQQRHLEEQQAQAEMESRKAEVAREHQRALERKLKDVKNAQKENELQLKQKMEMDRRAAHEEHQRVLDKKLRELNVLMKEGFQEKIKKMEAEIQQLRERSSSEQSRGGGGGCVLS